MGCRGRKEDKKQESKIDWKGNQTSGTISSPRLFDLTTFLKRVKYS
jgi:hypothetical protein